MSRPSVDWNDGRNSYLIDDGVGGKAELTIEEILVLADWVILRERGEKKDKIFLNENSY